MKVSEGNLVTKQLHHLLRDSLVWSLHEHMVAQFSMNTSIPPGLNSVQWRGVRHRQSFRSVMTKLKYVTESWTHVRLN